MPRQHFALLIAPFVAAALGLSAVGGDRPPVHPARHAIPIPLGQTDVGRRVELPNMKDFHGKVHPWGDVAGETLTVIAMTDLTCPVALRYRPKLAQLEDAYRDKGVRFVFLNAAGTDSAADVAESRRQGGFEGPWVNDADRCIAKALGATTTAEVFVLDAARTLVYRGAIDDQYGIDYAVEKPRHVYLIDALDAALAGERPKVAATSAPGCVLDLADAPAPSAAPVTYHNRVSRIVADNCLSCHRTGGVAPFALDTHDAVAKRAGMIKFVVDKGLMPPWTAAPSDDPALHFANDRSLPPRDKSDLLAWLDAGKPEGDPADAPLPRAFPGDWQIGTPDVVFKLPQPMPVQAEGFMEYTHVRVPTNFTEDKWIKAVQLKPTDTRVVHHILVYAIPPADFEQTPEAQGRLRQTFAESAGFFAAYVPGNDHVIFPDGLAKKIPAGAVLIFQLHYTPNGVATTDQTEIGLVFAGAPPKHEVIVKGIVDRRLNIPPGAGDHVEGAEIPVSRDVMLVGLMPHMHVRGKAFKYDLTLPDGTIKTLLDVPRYDFNWQIAYRFAEPYAVPAGSKIKVTAVYDNSEANPANPDPTARVRWGDQTTDEMCIGYVEFYYADDTAE